ncbi:O-antigen ligase family protein [Sphingomonas sp. GCM10030256]|uniref:O-antigen ligase family protein n=1 Tax=Sphingomonas sp. GCM10030256 TaxID=3273427 RepID=UPI00360621F6
MSFPGREPAVEILRLADLPLGWRPLSLDPGATWRALLELLPAVALFAATAAASSRQRGQLALAVILFAAASVLLEAAQLIGVGWQADPAHRLWGTGFFSNRNHQAAFLALAVVLVAFAGPARSKHSSSARAGMNLSSPARAALIILFSAGVLGTGSRAGLVLLALALASSVLAFAGWRRRTLVTGLAGLLALVSILLLSSAGQKVIARFATAETDLRFTFWSDALGALLEYWPVGSGLGTFPTVLPRFEPLDHVTTAFPNNAHNDWLELVMEAGVLGAIALTAVLVLLCRSAWQLWRGRGDALQTAAFLGLGLLLVHSVVDYPLRMTALSALAGLLAGLLTGHSEIAPFPASECAFEPKRAPNGLVAPRRASIGVYAVLPASLLLLATAWSFYLTDQAASSAKPSAAAPLSLPWVADGRAAEQKALAALREGDASRLEASAREAIDQAPNRPLPPALLALAFRADDQAAVNLMGWAGSAGWREPVTNLWLVDYGLRTGNLQLAVLRSDAALRLGTEREKVSEVLRRLAKEPQARALIVDRLAVDPPWRGHFLSAGWGTGEDLSLLTSLQEKGQLKRSEAAAAVRRLGEAERWRDAWQAAVALGLRPNEASFAALEAPDDERTPFEWRVIDLPGTTAELQEDGTLSLEADAGTAGAVLTRRLALAPGQYAIDVDDLGRESEFLRWTAQCTEGQQADLVPEGTSQLNVPANCSVISLELRWTGRQLSRSDVKLNAPRIRRISS